MPVVVCHSVASIASRGFAVVSSVVRLLLPSLLLSVSAAVPPASASAEDASKESGTAAAKLPLEAEDVGRRSFETKIDEATWLSADLSPDGTTLVVSVLGDLYTLPADGGTATPLPSVPPSLAFDSQPVWSPDGRWIAFLSDRDGAENLWIAPASVSGAEDEEEPQQLSKDEDADFASPAWSADGDYVLVSRAGRASGYEIWMYHTQGGAGVQVTKADPTGSTPRDELRNALGVEPSPDGRYLYFAVRRGGFQYNASLPMWQITRRDLVTGDEDVLTSAPGSAMRPRLSPDGSKLVYATRLDNRTGLRVRDLSSGEERWLAYPVQRDEQESRSTRDLYPGYDFTPDGAGVITTWGGKLHRVDATALDFGVGGLAADLPTSTEIPFEVAIDKELGPRLHVEQRIGDGRLRARLAQGAVLSPDRSQVAFSALARIYVAEVSAAEVSAAEVSAAEVSAAELDDSGQAPRPIGLTRGDIEAYQPAWSPDGRSLAFVTWSRDGGDLWTLPATGGTPRRLTEIPGFYSQPSWSPDGERIVFLRGSRQDRLEMPNEFGGSSLPLDLVWVPSTGGDLELIAPARGLGRPHFGPEQDRIYVHSPQGLQSLRWDGTDRRTHLVVKGPNLYFSAEPAPASELQISPDGRWVLGSVSNRFFLIALPAIGGAAPEVDVSSPSVPVKQISRLGADSFGWSDGGRTIHWTVGATLFQLPVGDVSFDPPKPDDSSEDDAAGSKEAPPKSFPEATGHELIVEVERRIPEGSVVLRGARVITMGDADGGVIESADVVVERNRILAVGETGTVEVPEGAQVIDVSGKTIVPGFVDTHAHWTEIRRGVLDTDAWTFLANLAYGVTTGLDVQTMTNDMFAYQDLLDAGRMIGPRAFSTGPGIFSNNDFQSFDDAKALLERYRDHYDTRNLKAYISGNRKQRQWIVQAAHELGMMPTTEGALDMKLDLTHAIDGFAGNEHSLPVVPLYDDVARLFAASGTGYTPTLLVAYGGPWAENWFYTEEVVHEDEKLRRFVPHDVIDRATRKRQWFREEEHVFPLLAESAAKIVRAGGRVGVGAHGQLQGLGYHWELWALHSGGLTELEALRAATLHGAEIIGLERAVGSLEPGKLADLLILDANPLDDIRHTNTVDRVMKNGELFDGDTLDQIWPVERSLPALWWWSADPGRP